MLKPGDVVIKTTGGNKMTIYSIENGIYTCFWFIDDKMIECNFKENEIVTLDDYTSKYLKIEERDDKLKKLFN